MGVNFVVVCVLVTISYIKAQEYYVILDETNLNTWDTNDQNPIYLDQSDHVIHRRDIETDLEGSGNGDSDLPAALPEEHLSNLTSSGSESKDPPAKDNPVEAKQEITIENVGLQISNFGEVNSTISPEETPKSNETKTEPDQSSIDNTNVQNGNNETDLPSVVTKSEIKEDKLPTTLQPVQAEPLNIDPIKPIPEKAVNKTTNQTEKPEPAIKTETETVAIETTNSPTEKTTLISKEIPALPPLIPSISNETNSHQEETTVKVEQSPSQSTVPPASKTDTNSPTEKTTLISKEIPALPPLIPSISNETNSHQEETTVKVEQSPRQSTVPPASKTDSTKLPEKEGGSVISSSSNNETKDSGKEEQTKVTPQVLPSDLAEVESINKQKESESVNEKQSGNAVMFKAPKSDEASQVEGSESEKALLGIAENAKISNEPTEQPATGESAKNVSRAGKDTTILVVLFVVVIAIGGAAFTHNYIKKRKQSASTNNDLVNGIRRSLQNLSSSNAKHNTDVEQGTELKPLMKDNSPTIVTKDYIDTKKEIPA